MELEEPGKQALSPGAELRTGGPGAETWQRCWLWLLLGGEVTRMSPLLPEPRTCAGRGGSSGPGRKETGEGGVEDGWGGHLQQALTGERRAPLPGPVVPRGARGRGGRSKLKVCSPAGVSSVLMSESYDRAGKPLGLPL